MRQASDSVASDSVHTLWQPRRRSDCSWVGSSYCKKPAGNNSNTTNTKIAIIIIVIIILRILITIIVTIIKIMAIAIITIAITCNNSSNDNNSKNNDFYTHSNTANNYNDNHNKSAEAAMPRNMKLRFLTASKTRVHGGTTELNSGEVSPC